MATFPSPDAQLAAIKAEAARDAATGWRDLPESPAGLQTSGATWSRDATGLYTATLPDADHADPSAGAWMAWPTLAADGHPVREEWMGAVQLNPERTLEPGDNHLMYGYADGPLDVATIAVLWTITVKATGARRAMVWVLDSGTWSLTFASDEASNSTNRTGVRGTMTWAADASGVDPTASTEHSARLVENGGAALNRATLCATDTTDLDWGSIFAGGGQVWSVLAAISTDDAVEKDVGMRIREIVQPLDRRAARGDDLLPARMVVGLGQSNLGGKHLDGDPESALSLSPTLATGTHWRSNGGRFGPGLWAGEDTNFGSGIRASTTSGATTIHRIVVESTDDGKSVQTMIDTYLPALIVNARKAGFPRVPVDLLYIDQGESDSISEAAALAWKAKMETVIATARAEWGPDLMVTLVKKTATDPVVQPGQAALNAQIDAIVAADPLAYARETSSTQLVADGLHRDAQSLFDDGVWASGILVSAGRWPT